MENSNIPELRFQNYSGEWKQHSVAEITEFHKQGFYTTENYGKSKKYYLLRGTDLTNNRLVLKNTPKIDATEKDYNDFKTEIGDFLVVRSGTVGTYGIVDIDIPAIFGSYLIDFRFDKTQITNEFFGYFYQSDLFKKQLRQIIQQSANTNINAENIKSTKVNLPTIPEQKNIGKFFMALDKLITLEQERIARFQNTKKFMLEKMFPQDGCKVPEIRFKGFSENWEQYKIYEIANRFDNLRIPVAANMRVPGPTPYYGANGIQDYVKGFTHEGEYVLIAEDGANDLKNYPIQFVNGRIWVNNHAHVLQGIPELVDNHFLAYALHQVNMEPLLVGSGRSKLNAEILMQIVFMMPTKEEQTKIGKLLDLISQAINFHHQKYEKLKNLKQALLAKMFV